MLRWTVEKFKKLISIQIMFNVVSDTLIRPSENHYHDLVTLERENFPEKVWLNLEIIGNGTEAESVKRIIQISFEDIFFDNPHKDVYERFEETLKEINLLLKNLREKNEENNFCEINAIIGVQDEQNLHLTQSGEGETYLIRNGKLTVVSEGLSVRKNEDSDIFLNIASGEISVNDILVLTSKRLLRYLTAQQITDVFKQNIPEALAAINALIADTNALAVTAVFFKRSIFINAENPPENRQQILQKEPLQKIKVYFDDFVKWIATKMGRDPNQVESLSIFVGVVVVLVVLFIGVTLLFSNNLDKEKYAEYNTAISNATEELKRAEKLALIDDSESANAILDKVEGRVVQILNEGYFRTESVQILDKVKELKDQVNNIQRITNPKILADLSTKRTDVNLLGLTELSNKLFAFEYNALYETILDQVEEPLTINSTEKVKAGAAMAEKDLIVFLTETDKVIEYNAGSFNLAETDDSMWKKGKALAIYGKYLYLLSPEENQIWKYERRKAGYSKASEYNLDADLSKSLDIAIDGSVFILNEGGEIIKLYRGNKQNFTISNIDAVTLQDIDQIFTLPDQNNLYLLNSQKNSVLIVKKLSNGQGEYQRQVILEGVGQVVDIYVEQNEQKLFAVDKGKIYEIGL